MGENNLLYEKERKLKGGETMKVEELRQLELINSNRNDREKLIINSLVSDSCGNGK